MLYVVYNTKGFEKMENKEEHIYSKIGYFRREVRRCNEKIAKLCQERERFLSQISHLSRLMENIQKKKKGASNE
jgi:uncharacterized coiled-coil DUF342 family protein